MRLRTVLAILGVLFTVAASQAQLVRGYGFKVGSVLSNENWNGENYSGNEFLYKWGFTASAFVELVDIPSFSLITEAQYVQKGVKIIVHVTQGVGPRTRTYLPRVDYLSMPLMAKLRFSGSHLEAYFVAGPRFDFLVSKSQTRFFDSWGVNLVESEAGWIAGLGLESSSLVPVHLLVEIRFNAGFGYSFTRNNTEIRSRSFDFMLGMRL